MVDFWRDAPKRYAVDKYRFFMEDISYVPDDSIVFDTRLPYPIPVWRYSGKPQDSWKCGYVCVELEDCKITSLVYGPKDYILDLCLSALYGTLHFAVIQGVDLTGAKYSCITAYQYYTLPDLNGTWEKSKLPRQSGKKAIHRDVELPDTRVIESAEFRYAKEEFANV